MRLTDAGEALLPHARAALAAAERGRDAIASVRGVLRGRLRIGVAGPVDQRLSQALGEFHRAHPGVEVMLTIQNNEPLLAAVAGGHMDVGIVGIGIRPLPPQGARHREAFEKAFDDAGFVPRIAAEAGELSSLVELVAEGLGAAILPRPAADGAEVAVVEITRPRLVRRTALAWNDATTSPAGRAFLGLRDARSQHGPFPHRRRTDGPGYSVEAMTRAPVFVFADDGLNVFENLDRLGGWIEGIDVENGVYEAIFTLDGHVVRAVAKGADAVLTVTATVDEAGLKQRVRRYAERFESDPDDLAAVANELLDREWDARWPKRPRWLSRRLHGERPPHV